MAVDLTKPPRPPSDMADKFMLRLPDGMRDRLKAEAEANKRSMNAEIVARLEESLTYLPQDGASHDPIFVTKRIAIAIADQITQRLLGEAPVDPEDVVAVEARRARLLKIMDMNLDAKRHRDDPEGAN